MIADYRIEYRSRLVAIGDWRCRPRAATPGGEEATSEHQIVFVRSGAFRKHVGRGSVVADPASAVFFPRGEAYRVSHPVPGGDRCVVLTLQEGALGEISALEGPPARRDPRHPFAVPAVPIEPRLALRMRRLAARAAAAPPGGVLDVDEAALLVAGEVLRRARALRAQHRPARDGTLESHRRAVERVRLLAVARFRDRLTLETIAREAACSPYHLCRLFTDQTGMPIHRYLNRLRLLAALEGLGPRADLSRLAHDVGFSSHSHFTAAFRRQFGAPPSIAARSLAAVRSLEPECLARFRKNVIAGAGAPR